MDEIRRAHLPAGPEKPPIRVRAPRLSFDGVRRHWFGGSRAATHMWNGVNLLFPGGERFFVRSVRHYNDRLSPELLARVKSFCGQEGRHAQAHERLFATLREQGFDVDTIVERYERIAFDYLEKLAPPALRLSITVAAEHFTALMAQDALTVDVADAADPALRDLFIWHAVEELEHKDVAFDVLAEVAPSYALRLAGMVIGATVLAGFWIYATNALLEQDGSSLLEARRELETLRHSAKRSKTHSIAGNIGARVFVRGVMKYFRRDFHPAQRDHSELITRTLARLAAGGVIAADPATT